MSKMVELMERLQLPEGFSESLLEGVRFFKSLQPILRTPLLYDPGICILTQGSKIGYLGNQSFQYDASNYLVISVAIPFECETFASPDNPLLGLYIDVDMPLLHDLIAQVGHRLDFVVEERNRALPRGIGPAPMDEDMVDATVRLLGSLQSETETRVLADGLMREILYRVLCGPQAPVLHALASHSGSFARVARALKLIHRDYAGKLDVERLAQEAHMSTSAFHRAFKEITSDSPMQYLKKFRLNKARDLMVQEEAKAYIAADKVGYESVSQFSREFKRYFGRNPAEIIRGLRNIPAFGSIQPVA